MKNRPLSVKRLFLWICIGLLLSMTAITFILFSLTLEVAVLIAGAALIGCALVWFLALTQAFGKRLSRFTSDLCKTLDNMMDGDEEVFFAIGGSDDALIKVASRFAQVDFDEFDSDAYDAICEFINCTNGMFATKLSDQEIKVVLRPPVFYGDASISGDNGFYVVTMEIDGTEFNVIMSVSDKVRLKTIKTNCV